MTSRDTQGRSASHLCVSDLPFSSFARNSPVACQVTGEIALQIRVVGRATSEWLCPPAEITATRIGTDEYRDHH
jgi:hypothetical protein